MLSCRAARCVGDTKTTPAPGHIYPQCSSTCSLPVSLKRRLDHEIVFEVIPRTLNQLEPRMGTQTLDPGFRDYIPKMPSKKYNQHISESRERESFCLMKEELSEHSALIKSLISHLRTFLPQIRSPIYTDHHNTPQSSHSHSSSP